MSGNLFSNRQAHGQGSTATLHQSGEEKWCLAEDEDPIKELSVWAWDAWDILSIFLSTTLRQWEITTSCVSGEKTTKQYPF